MTVSVISYTSRSLRTSPAILDLDEDPERSIPSSVERRDVTRWCLIAGREGGGWLVGGGGGGISPCSESAPLSFNHSPRKQGFSTSYFLSEPQTRDNIDFTV